MFTDPRLRKRAAHSGELTSSSSAAGSSFLPTLMDRVANYGPTTKLVIMEGLPRSMSTKILSDFLEKEFGLLQSLYCPRRRSENGPSQCRGVAFACFNDPQHAAMALKKSPLMLDGHEVFLDGGEFCADELYKKAKLLHVMNKVGSKFNTDSLNGLMSAGDDASTVTCSHNDNGDVSNVMPNNYDPGNVDVAVTYDSASYSFNEATCSPTAAVYDSGDYGAMSSYDTNTYDASAVTYDSSSYGDYGADYSAAPSYDISNFNTAIAADIGNYHSNESSFVAAVGQCGVSTSTSAPTSFSSSSAAPNVCTSSCSSSGAVHIPKAPSFSYAAALKKEPMVTKNNQANVSSYNDRAKSKFTWLAGVKQYRKYAGAVVGSSDKSVPNPVATVEGYSSTDNGIPALSEEAHVPKVFFQSCNDTIVKEEGEVIGMKDVYYNSDDTDESDDSDSEDDKFQIKKKKVKALKVASVNVTTAMQKVIKFLFDKQKAMRNGVNRYSKYKDKVEFKNVVLYELGVKKCIDAAQRKGTSLIMLTNDAKIYESSESSLFPKLLRTSLYSNVPLLYASCTEQEMLTRAEIPHLSKVIAVHERGDSLLRENPSIKDHYLEILAYCSSA